MCCGRNSGPFRTGSPGYQPSRAAQATAPTAAPPSAWTFEYVGRTRLVVIGPATGRQYLFAGPGIRLQIDPRDRAAVAAVPMLKRVGVIAPLRR